MSDDQLKDADTAKTVDIQPLILCDQGGLSFWPRSRPSSPDLLVQTTSETSDFGTLVQTFEQTGLRAPVIIAPSEGLLPLQQQLQELGQSVGTIIETPAPSGTAVTVCTGIEYLAQIDPEQLVLICLADNWTYDPDDLHKALRTASPLATSGHLVMFGVPCDSNRPNMVHIEMAQGNAASRSPQPIAHMTFAPIDLAIDHMISTNRYLCAADIVLCTAKSMRAAYGKHAATIRAHVRRAVRDGQQFDGIFRPAMSRDPYSQEDFRRSILEHEQGYVVPCKFEPRTQTNWSDYLQASPKDDSGSHVSGHAVAINCAETLVINDSHQTNIVAVGLDSIAVIATPDAILVTDLNALDQVPTALQSLTNKGTANLPGGFGTALATGPNATIYADAEASLQWIELPPGAATSEKQHNGPDLTWVVTAGLGEVTIDGAVTLVSQNSAISLLWGQKYRILNTGQTCLRLIEIATAPHSETATPHETPFDDLGLTSG